MRFLHTVLCIAMILAWTGCGESSSSDGDGTDSPQTGQVAQEETPAEGAAAILALLKDEDYTTLVRERYSEWERALSMPEADSPEQMTEEIASRLARHRDRMIDIYEQLAEADFTVQENESPQPGESDRMAVASFTYDGRELEARLYLMEDGHWGFHL
jgi:hypothetical protein